MEELKKGLHNQQDQQQQCHTEQVHKLVKERSDTSSSDGEVMLDMDNPYDDGKGGLSDPGRM